MLIKWFFRGQYRYLLQYVVASLKDRIPLQSIVFCKQSYGSEEITLTVSKLAGEE